LIVAFSFLEGFERVKHKGRAGTSYTDRITRAHPMYLHELYRQATSLLGDDATFEETAAMVNL
jgi:hypothetical protein